MPTYDYECRDCGHVFEVFHGMTEQPRLECPKCGGTPQRLISGGGAVIFKGPGFYATDSRSSGRTACGLGTPCCGRDSPCDSPPCEE